MLDDSKPRHEQSLARMASSGTIHIGRNLLRLIVLRPHMLEKRLIGCKVPVFTNSARELRHRRRCHYHLDKDRVNKKEGRHQSFPLFGVVENETEVRVEADE